MREAQSIESTSRRHLLGDWRNTWKTSV